MGRLRAAFVLASLSGATVAACTLLTNLDGFTGGATGNGTDATLEGATPGDSGTTDTSSADGARDSAMGTDAPADAPPAFMYTCAASGMMVSDCASCGAAKFPCVLCGANGADTSKVRGYCVSTPTSSACEGKGPSGFDDCLCTSSSNPSVCLEPYQICVVPSGPACRTCGFDGGTGLKCKGGGTCSAANTCL